MTERRGPAVGDLPGGLKLIACPAVLGELADGATDGVDCQKLEAQLHVSPERLKEALRAAVADADKPGATIVLGYGLCSNAVLGLKTEHATLVVPRVDDCIAMMLGSNEAFAAESEKACGTYYVAKAYLEECDTIMSEHEKLVEKRGLERAEQMMRLLLAHYTRIVLIDTGRYDLEPYRARVAEFAERFDLAVEDVPGTTRILDALVEGGWDDDFVVAPPGHELTLQDFRPELMPGDRWRAAAAVAGAREPLCIAGFLGRARRPCCSRWRGPWPSKASSLAIVENEIGEVGVDGGAVRKAGLPVRELFGGCICCTLQTGLVETLRTVEAQYDPDWVIVEPTGLAAPGDITAVRSTSTCPTSETFRVLTLVDAERWEMLLAVVEPAHHGAARGGGRRRHQQDRRGGRRRRSPASSGRARPPA